MEDAEVPNCYKINKQCYCLKKCICSKQDIAEYAWNNRKSVWMLKNMFIVYAGEVLLTEFWVHILQILHRYTWNNNNNLDAFRQMQMPFYFSYFEFFNIFKTTVFLNAMISKTALKKRFKSFKKTFKLHSTRNACARCLLLK